MTAGPYRAGGRPAAAVQARVWLLRRVRRVRRPRTVQDWIGAALLTVFAVAVAVQLLGQLLRALVATWWVIPALLVAGGAVWWTRGRARSLRALVQAQRRADLTLPLAEIDVLDPQEFEVAVADLMMRDKITAWRVGGSDDQAADVIGLHAATGTRIVVQCKHTTRAANVGAPVIYQVNGTAGPAHRADVAVVVTNGGFTPSARRNAEQFRIALLGRAELERWAAHGISLPELLGLGTGRGRRHRLRFRFDPAAAGPSRPGSPGAGDRASSDRDPSDQRTAPPRRMEP
ncbi:restriction endonuclease [Actinomadura violacea]|uniref:Restriction endonuclease n=1 Tax=Actinomadura violacea TaxID=2819934 RepID=A0ABS3RYF4_9ACTN|nr:restriction endonuclease [Actinomadura violacea]MBO2461493.1 restriction endonuclease [Actinomadura violacea]